MANAARFDRRSTLDNLDPSHRSPTQRDRDRVLYSDAFRRLGGVTQVAIGRPSMSLHNRLTHSLKVEQVGQSIYSMLNATVQDLDSLADPWAVSAACLAHDIGHPPFGHAAEEELNEILICGKHRREPREFKHRDDDPCSECVLEDGFEGNAQSFRVVHVLSVHRDSTGSHPRYGLDFTRASSLALSKYPWTKGVGKASRKWGAYDCDAPHLKWAADGQQAGTLTLDAQIMDWADDISYAVHDIEDFFRTGLIPLNDYRKASPRLKTFYSYVESPTVMSKLTKATKESLEGLLELFPSAAIVGTRKDMEALDRARGFLLDKFIGTTTLINGNLNRDSVQNQLNQLLKQFIWFHIIDDPNLASIQAGQRRVIREIYDFLARPCAEAYGAGGTDPSEKELRRLPHALRHAVDTALEQSSTSYKRPQKISRGLIDFIAGLSDQQAYGLHAVLRGRAEAGSL